jgi:hypothetical protein
MVLVRELVGQRFVQSDWIYYRLLAKLLYGHDHDTCMVLITQAYGYFCIHLLVLLCGTGAKFTAWVLLALYYTSHQSHCSAYNTWTSKTLTNFSSVYVFSVCVCVAGPTQFWPIRWNGSLLSCAANMCGGHTHWKPKSQTFVCCTCQSSKVVHTHSSNCWHFHVHLHWLLVTCQNWNTHVVRHMEERIFTCQIQWTRRYVRILYIW